jgi:hypothetical protein
MRNRERFGISISGVLELGDLHERVVHDAVVLRPPSMTRRWGGATGSRPDNSSLEKWASMSHLVRPAPT